MTLNPLIQQLIAPGPVLTDGAWGTQLQARGLAPGEAPDLWNLTRPEKVAEVARAYVDAGSQIILTNTFGANRFRLAEARRGGQGQRNQRSRRAHFPRSGGRTRARFRLHRAQRQNADERRRDGGGIARRVRRTGAGAGRAAARTGLVVETMQDLDEAQHRHRRGQSHRPAGRRQHGVRFRQGQGPHDDGRHAGTGGGAVCWKPARMSSARIAARASPGL